MDNSCKCLTLIGIDHGSLECADCGKDWSYNAVVEMLHSVTSERDKHKSDLDEMVKKACEEKLPAYREQGRKIYEMEIALEERNSDIEECFNQVAAMLRQAVIA